MAELILIFKISAILVEFPLKLPFKGGILSYLGSMSLLSNEFLQVRH